MSDVKQIDVLDRMIIREDVLQICYWYQGEGHGECNAGCCDGDEVCDNNDCCPR